MPGRILASILLIIVFFSLASSAVQDDPERQQAFTLFKDWKLSEALPLFEKLAVRYPEDPQVIETYGMVLIWHTSLLEDAAARKEARKRGRDLLVKAEKLGSNSALLKKMLESIAPDGGNDEKFSAKKEVDEAMREGEAA